MSDSDGKGSPPPVTGRHEKSLGLLTSKFVELLQSSKGGILDLKKARGEKKLNLVCAVLNWIS